jgi:phosphomannomutase / phosphoglucomutase
MQVPVHVFREYDIRGVAERDLSSDLARAIGRGYAKMIGEGASGAGGAGASGKPLRICVGRDCRISSPRLHQALVDGLLRSGVHVIDVGVGPTPMLYFSVHHTNADGGIMITGSHNPGDENGFKMMRGKGSFFGADIQNLRKLIESGDFGAEADGGGESMDVREAYLAALTKDIQLGGASGMKVVLDAGNGSGGPLGVAAITKAGITPDTLFCDMDGRFPNHHPDPTVPKNLDALIARVRETGARVGLAYDGDADRLGAVDANGDIVWGDKLMILFSRALLKRSPGAAILGEVKCSQTLYDDIAKHGGRGIMWKTGHSLIKTKMKEEHALLAGEMSGHLFFADRYFGYDDALYAGLRLLEILAADPRSIGEMLSDVPTTFATPELRVDCPDAIKFDVVKAITARYKDKGLAVADIDGARVQFGTPAAPAWGLVRASNTGPVLVMRFEATTEAERDRLRGEVEAAVAEERGKLTAASGAA